MESIRQTLSTLFLIFLVLKLTGLVAWSWWAVTAPIWVPILLWPVLYVLLAMLAMAAGPRKG